MNRLITILLLLLFSFILLVSVTLDDLEFCVKREFWQVIGKNQSEIADSVYTSGADDNWYKPYLIYLEQKGDTVAVLDLLKHQAIQKKDLEAALNWVDVSRRYSDTQNKYDKINTYNQLLDSFNKTEDKMLLLFTNTNAPEDSLFQAISRLKIYNKQIEDIAKTFLDRISVERDADTAKQIIGLFNHYFPYSEWRQAVYYFELSLKVKKDEISEVLDSIEQNAHLSSAFGYICTLYLNSPSLRRKLNSVEQGKNLLAKSLAILDSISIDHKNLYRVLYDSYSAREFAARISLQKAKTLYYYALAENGYYGDEESPITINAAPETLLEPIMILDSVTFPDNDNGQKAELAFWKGKTHALINSPTHQEKSIHAFIDCLILGSPRNKYDREALQYLTHFYYKIAPKTDLMFWIREKKQYTGPVFSEIAEKAGLKGCRESRTAIGDYNNDSFPDILLNGKRLFHNNGNLTFSEVTDSTGLSDLNACGGLFADFNLDGKLDFVTISHGELGNGERLMKNMGGKFAPVNDRAGDIDDRMPTEGAAWIDSDLDCYPDLYLANYEKWNVRSGYPDFFWDNRKGYFANKSVAYGFHTPEYTIHPGQAGRGVASADFDNDGEQEILVCNYRLDRNFLWDKQDTVHIDIAAASLLQGLYKKGYYGHSIGADWGDYDNDGDLDLFIANLAHPRFIEISDISMLLRNDGLQFRIIGTDTLSYWKFSDVTKQAGITYDELHSDPMWFDIDNDGHLDLYITSIYENERSYLYRNNGNGTFTDITWLSGTRVYNGWGNAFADFNRDGKLDFITGSGSGVKLFINQTNNHYQFLVFKPVWENGKVSLISSNSAIKKKPNSPAFGTRVKLKLKTPDGQQLTLIRELCSAKGTTSQSQQILHFGIGKNKVMGYQIVDFNKEK